MDLKEKEVLAERKGIIEPMFYERDVKSTIKILKSKLALRVGNDRLNTLIDEVLGKF